MKGEAINTGNDGELAYKRTNDPRVTRIGRFLRKTSIDELPQFINVLKGEMTLVGPRPPLPYEVEYYSAYEKLRMSGKPGLTGPWQIYGRSRVPFQTMVEMDIAYLQRQSIREDLKLIMLTIVVMLQGMGGA
jgi:lipopolysaccharide/colanic/teichoic acid biosynthesis glycosyltransferase